MDRTQFEAFLLEFRPLLVLRAEQITGDPGTAEDVVQMTSIYLLSNLHRYNPTLSALAWVLEAVKRRAFNALRGQARFVPLVDDFSEEYGIETPGVDQDYEERRQGDLLAEMLGVIASEEPEHYRLAEGLLRGDELAQMGSTKQAADQMIRRAFIRWRKLLSKRFTKAEIETALGR